MREVARTLEYIIMKRSLYHINDYSGLFGVIIESIDELSIGLLFDLSQGFLWLTSKENFHK